VVFPAFAGGATFFCSLWIATLSGKAGNLAIQGEATIYGGLGIFGNSLGVSYRYARRTSYTNNWIYNSEDQRIPMPESVVFLRVTRIASANLVFSEWSLDGETWHLADQRVLPMNPSVGYGIDLANGEDNEELTHARASKVCLSLPGPMAIRSLSQGYYSAGEPLDVTLEIVHAGNQPKEATGTVGHASCYRGTVVLRRDDLTIGARKRRSPVWMKWSINPLLRPMSLS